MNLLSKIALLLGRRKFEEFAQANPTLPDDALAVANTLDTYPVRGAVTLVAGSLAQALDNVLRGTETIDAAATHALLILAALCIIWVRHAISKHDVRVNDVIQKARTISGIGSKTLPMIIAFGLGAWLFVSSPNCRASAPLADSETAATGTVALPATNKPVGDGLIASGSASVPLAVVAGDSETAATGTIALSATNKPIGDGLIASGSASVPLAVVAGDSETAVTGTVALPATNNTPLDNAFTQLVTDIGKSTKFSSGVGINLHAKIAPLLSQELPLFGRTGTNSSWSTGPSHATFFLPAENQEQLGWSLSGSWKSPPRLLRFALFNASDIDWTFNWGLPVEDYYQLFRHVDWKENRFGLSVTRKF
jgi:hypothetical protein